MNDINDLEPHEQYDVNEVKKEYAIVKGDPIPGAGGKYAQMRRRFLKEHRPGTYTAMFIKDTLYEHIAEVQHIAEERLDTLMEQMLKKDPPPDKATDQMGWVGHMNMTKAMAEEV